MSAAVAAAVLPEGFGLPPLPYLLGLAAVGLAVGAGLARVGPAVTERRILGLVPWMVAGAVAHVAHVLGTAPQAVDPLLGTPAVYASAAVLAGATWLGADALGDAVAAVLAVVGTAATLPWLWLAVADAVARETLTPAWPAVALVGGVALGAATWAVLSRVAPAASTVAGRIGAVAVVGHAVDGVSTAVGIDVLGFAERTPLSRLIVEAAAELPTEPLIGSGWLFVLVKLGLAAAVVRLLADSVRETPAQGRLLLALVAGVGLGPGIHNVVLFAVA